MRRKSLAYPAWRGMIEGESCLAMSTASSLRLTNADVESMPEDGNRYELIDGELHVSSAPGFIHQTVLTRIVLAVGNYLAEHPIGVVVPGVGVIFDEYNGVIPDLVIASNERIRKALAGGRFRKAPEVAIEILSPGTSNQRRDRHVKLALYAARGVDEYWIVDPENRSVEIHRRDAAGLLAFNSCILQNDELNCGLLPGFSVRIDTLFV
jgi:Uma2 family endonuclease